MPSVEGAVRGATRLQFVRAGGPGGQHVNKVATAVQAHLSISDLGLPPAVAARLRRIAGNRLTDRDEIVVGADRHRSQKRNREDALQRLEQLVGEAWQRPKRRIPTKPSAGARARRMDTKKKQGARKQMRRKPSLD